MFVSNTPRCSAAWFERTASASQAGKEVFAVTAFPFRISETPAGPGDVNLISISRPALVKMSPVPADATEQRKLAAIMFTDMVGYSALAQKDEALALQLLDEHQILLRPFFPKFNGREVETIGDAFLVEFTSALDAVRCAIAIQKALAERNASSPGTAKIQIRIGVHVGDVVQREKNVLGDSVNIAARIEPLAKPGGICVTQQVFDQIHNKLEMPLLKLGSPELKNIQVPVCLYHVVLPWDAKHTSQREPARFPRPKQRQRAAAIATALILVCLGVVIWQRTWRNAASAQTDRIESLVVLPLANLSGDPSKEYFSNGLTESLTTELGKISSLSVSSAQGVAHYKKAGTPLAKMLNELKVDAWVEGSTAHDGQRVAINVRLIRASTGRQLWQTNSTTNFSNIVDLQGEVALALAEAMKAKLLPSERTLLSTARPVHPEAYDFYLRGNFAYLEKIDLTIQMLERAIEIDPGFAQAHAKLALAYFSKASHADPDAIAKVHEALNRAIKLDPVLPEIYDVRSRLFFTRAQGWNFEQALAESAKALQLNHTLDGVHQFRGVVHWHIGLVDKALSDFAKVRALNPRHPQVLSEIGGCYLFQTNYAKTLHYMTNFPPDYPAPLSENGIASAYQHLGQTNQAWAVVNTYLNSGLPDPGGLMASMQAVLYADAGDKAEALKKIDQAQQLGKNFAHFHHTTYNLATAYALLNDPEQAIKWLRQTADDGFPNYVWFQRDPNLASLRRNPDFIEFMAELEKRWKHFNETL